MTASESLQALAFVMLVIFLSYVCMILVPFLRRKRDEDGDPAAFAWHVFVPCRDEEAVIEDTLDRLVTDFPLAHVWIVDDHSTDATAELVSMRASADARIHLVRRRLPEARQGKGAALNAAYRALNGWLPADADRDHTVIVVVDADGQLAPNALHQAAGPRAFGDPTTGAAQAAVWMSNRNDDRPIPGARGLRQWWGHYLVRMQDIEFRTTIAAMQCLRGHTLSVGLGGNGQFTRLATLDAIAGAADTPWHGSLLEDYELGIHVMLAGFRNVYLHDTHVAQEALPFTGKLLTQRTRWCQGGMQCTKYLSQIFFSRNFTNAGAIEAAYFMLMPFLQLAGTVLWPLVFLISAAQGAIAPGGLETWLATTAWVVPLMLLTGVLPFALWALIYWKRDERRGSILTALGWAVGYWLYMYQSYVVVIRAFVRLVLGRNGWSKTKRIAEYAPQSAAPAAAPQLEVVR
ncbi:glycosyltransferase family 2 protein [Gryllotalpicola kribbensis]|jgi:cellulose synthase/poly-beta-1,6-N-acetylglucosamine synthase-like glycosyltransferase|uniref:Glycosyltransferase family 2 protein n=1 Tax=Gryllotalpicola kribbensis TaxID=993084 RepID=A0ABP8AQF3_9MICO